MVPAVGAIPVSFYLLSRDEEPFTVLTPPSVDLAVDDFDLGMVTVGHIAAGFRGIDRHVPRRIEFFVQCQVRGGVTIVLLGLRPNRGQDNQRHSKADHGGLRGEELTATIQFKLSDS